MCQTMAWLFTCMLFFSEIHRLGWPRIWVSKILRSIPNRHNTVFISAVRRIGKALKHFEVDEIWCDEDDVGTESILVQQVSSYLVESKCLPFPIMSWSGSKSGKGKVKGKGKGMPRAPPPMKAKGSGKGVAKSGEERPVPLHEGVPEKWFGMDPTSRPSAQSHNRTIAAQEFETWVLHALALASGMK